MKRIAIVGSRDYPNPEHIRGFVRRLPPGTVVISGGARGADQIAEDAARGYGLTVVVVPAEWDKYGKSAGFRRNKLIVHRADYVVAFWDGESGGTQNTLKWALKMKRPFAVFGVDGELIATGNHEYDSDGGQGALEQAAERVRVAAAEIGSEFYPGSLNLPDGSDQGTPPAAA